MLKSIAFAVALFAAVSSAQANEPVVVADPAFEEMYSMDYYAEDDCSRYGGSYCLRDPVSSPLPPKKPTPPKKPEYWDAWGYEE